MFGIIKKCFFVFLTNIVNASTAIQNLHPEVIKNGTLKLLLLNYILIDTIKLNDRKLQYS